jgi:hypothetical protein
MTTTSIQATPTTHEQGRVADDIWKIGPGAAPPKQTGKGSGSGPSVSEAPPVLNQKNGNSTGSKAAAAVASSPAPHQNRSSVDPEPVNTALNNWSRARSDYEKADENVGASNYDRDKVVARGVAKENLARADVALGNSVTSTIKKSCHGKCGFRAAHAAANDLDTAARKEGEELLKAGVSRDVVLARQLALRTATSAVLLDAALRELKSLADPKSPQDRNKLISDVASWVAEKQDPPIYPNELARIKPLVAGLIGQAKVDPAKSVALYAIAKELVAMCKKLGA